MKMSLDATSLVNANIRSSFLWFPVLLMNLSPVDPPTDSDSDSVLIGTETPLASWEAIPFAKKYPSCAPFANTLIDAVRFSTQEEGGRWI